MSRVVADDPAVVQPVFEELKKNFLDGTTRDAKFRKKALRRLIDGYRELMPEIDAALKKDLGQNAFQANVMSHAMTLADMQEMHENVEEWVKPEYRTTPISLGFADCSIDHEPLGVALILSAWNYPIYTGVPQAAAAIAAGNCVIMKPSELSPETSGMVKKLFDNYLDKKYYRCIEGKVEVGKAVTRLPVDIICFTGSTMTGRLVAIEAAKNLVPCILELGGKCPVIVDETAVIPTAVNRILFGKYLNAGQTCIGVDHVYVHESLKEPFKKQLLDKMEEFYGNGQNIEEEGNVNKIVNDFHMSRLEKLLLDKHGGEVIYGGNIKKENRFIYPTVVEAPKKDCMLMKEEIFGPILPMFYYTDLGKVIEEILSRPKPLAIYHFSESKRNIQMVREKTYSGAYAVNDCVMQGTNAALPFGGVGHSGYGRYHGKDGFLAFTNPKSVAHCSSMDKFPANQRYPPYTEEKKRLMTKLIKHGGVTTRTIGRTLLAVVLVIVMVILAAVLIPRYAK